MVRPLGHLLIEDGAITEDQLHRALIKQRELTARGRPERFGDLLVAMGFISTEELERTLARQEQERALPA